jgi:hypothetical protein
MRSRLCLEPEVDSSKAPRMSRSATKLGIAHRPATSTPPPRAPTPKPPARNTNDEHACLRIDCDSDANIGTSHAYRSNRRRG